MIVIENEEEFLDAFSKAFDNLLTCGCEGFEITEDGRLVSLTPQRIGQILDSGQFESLSYDDIEFVGKDIEKYYKKVWGSGGADTDKQIPDADNE